MRSVVGILACPRAGEWYQFPLGFSAQLDVCPSQIMGASNPDANQGLERQRVNQILAHRLRQARLPFAQGPEIMVLRDLRAQANDDQVAFGMALMRRRLQLPWRTPSELCGYGWRTASRADQFVAAPVAAAAQQVWIGDARLTSRRAGRAATERTIALFFPIRSR